MPAHNVSQDVEKFNEESVKINKMMDELELLFESKALIKILDRIPELVEFEKFYRNVEYLKNFKAAEEIECFIYELYLPIMKIAATSIRPFTDFTQANYDSLTRMKWKWLNSVLVPNHNQP